MRIQLDLFIHRKINTRSAIQPPKHLYSIFLLELILKMNIRISLKMLANMGSLIAYHAKLTLQEVHS